MHASLTTARENGVPAGARRERVFGRDHRLRTRAQLARVREAGQSRAGRTCVVIAWDPADGSRRLATIVSRRYSLKAVVRNRARRLLREAYRQMLPELVPAWLILIPRHRMKDAKLADVLGEVRTHCRKLGILRPAEPEAESGREQT